MNGAAPSGPAGCFHCGEPLVAGTTYTARLPQGDKAVCCAGCQAVAELISGAGLDDFYRFRTGPSPRPGSAAAASSPQDEWLAYDLPEVADALIRRDGGPGHEAAVMLALSGLRCAACAWLIERSVKQLPGVIDCQVSAAAGRIRVTWQDGTLRLSQLLGRIAALGYQPHPVGAAQAVDAQRDERRAGLKRLAVSGLGMMQVMMFAVALYYGDWLGMQPQHETYLRLASLLATLPVMLYAGRPFLESALRSVRARTVGMDVPVSIGLVLAFAASTVNALGGSGEVYFDSVTMFIFFLTLGRFVEMTARHRSGGVTDALARLVPFTAHRLGPGGIEDVATATLRPGDRIVVRPGECVPADGAVIDGAARCDESLLTGESRPLLRRSGDAVLAGAMLLDAPLTVRVTATQDATVLSGIVRLLERAVTDKPRLARAADRAAAWFLSRILAGAALTGLLWLWIDPDRALPATLAVLVVTCPCALSLATPAAISAATAALARRGILVARADAIEALAGAQVAVFDKTGTLTRGHLALERCDTLGAASEARCRQLAAALEQGSEHPLARALAAGQSGLPIATDVAVVAGAGVEGVIEGVRHRIGRRDYVLALRDGRAGLGHPEAADDVVVLGDESGLLAEFRVSDTLRPEAPAVMQSLRERGLSVALLSGDAAAPVADAARRSGIDLWHARQSPAGKLEQIRSLAADGRRVLMVGDGINDAPVLGGAAVAIAMGRGSALAQASADLVLVGDDLKAIPAAIDVSRRALAVMRQNLAWAAAYNLVALPLAALGYVPPWAASIGMSLSSIVVVLNAMRLSPRAGSRGDGGLTASSPLVPATAGANGVTP